MLFNSTIEIGKSRSHLYEAEDKNNKALLKVVSVLNSYTSHFSKLPHVSAKTAVKTVFKLCSSVNVK